MELRPFTDILERLADYAEQYTPGFRQSLNPSLSRVALQEALDQAGFAWHPPEEWFALYQWHNGYGGVGFGKKRASLFYYHEFMDVEEALADRKSKDEAEHDYGDPNDPFYLPNLLPVFNFHGGGNFVGLQSGTRTDRPGNRREPGRLCVPVRHSEALGNPV